MVSAFHLAGVQNVIGTLWPVSDFHCVDVARIVYETLRDVGMTGKAVCLGLQLAVRALRDGMRKGGDTRAGTDSLSNAQHVDLEKEPNLNTGDAPSSESLGQPCQSTDIGKRTLKHKVK